MTKKEIQTKIQALLDSGQGENTYIAVYMKVNEFGMSLREALASLRPIVTDKKYNNPNDFYCSIRIANIWIEYEFIEGYVPYMGTAATASRIVSYFKKDSLESIEGLSDFLPIEDSNSKKDVLKIIQRDYEALIPTLIKLLE